MAEQTFRSPGFFEREIDLTQRTTEIVGVPAGVIGTAQKGPAFVPVTVGSFLDFENKFGSLDPEKFGTYAVNQWLKNRTALTYVRVLGAGANSPTTDISNTQIAGTVKNAGFKLSGTRADGRFNGVVQFSIQFLYWFMNFLTSKMMLKVVFSLSYYSIRFLNRYVFQFFNKRT